jgi:GT2 family glycosyltransferase
VEIIIADGVSTDGTRELLSGWQQRFPTIQVLDNSDRIVSAGLNLAVSRARGSVIVRIDGHALIASDFLRQNVALLNEHPEAWSVGGPIRHVASTTFGRAVAVAMSHPLGVGNARHRYPEYEGYVEGAQFPAIRRSVFDRIGMFDERLVRNQDDEFNYRIRRAGGRVYVSPRVRYSYFVRGRVGQLFKQYFQYGFWRIPVIQKHGRPTTLRQVAPTLFYAIILLLMAVGAWLHQPWLAFGLPIAYLAALCGVAVSVAHATGLLIAGCVPLAIATMHAGYAIGVGYGLFARLFGASAWTAHSKMASISR